MVALLSNLDSIPTQICQELLRGMHRSTTLKIASRLENAHLVILESRQDDILQ